MSTERKKFEHEPSIDQAIEDIANSVHRLHTSIDHIKAKRTPERIALFEHLEARVTAAKYSMTDDGEC